LSRTARALLAGRRQQRSAQAHGRAAAVVSPLNAQHAASEGYHAAVAGVEVRYPYRDRRLVEFMLRVPEHQIYLGGESRRILRTAMTGILPEEIRCRSGKTTFGALFRRGMLRSASSRYEQLVGNPDRFCRAFVRCDWLASAPPGNRASTEDEDRLWRCLCLDLWHEATQAPQHQERESR
jgi:asparagine synthase (glutamine-hydrolysing)